MRSRFGRVVCAMAAAAALVAAGGASAATSAQGRGYGLNLSASLGNVVGLSAPLGDTGNNQAPQAPPAPQDFSTYAPLLSATAGVTALGLNVLSVNTGDIYGRTISALSKNKVDSEAQVVGLDVSVLGLPLLGNRANLLSLKADAVTAEARFTCVSGTAQPSGKASITGLSSSGTLGLLLNPLISGLGSLLNVAPNTGLNVQIPLVASLTLLLNEQSISGNKLTVNGLRLGVSVLGAINSDLTVAHAEATMPNCQAAPGSVSIAVPNINTSNQTAVPITGSCTVGGGTVTVSSNPSGNPSSTTSTSCGGAGTYSANINASPSGSNLPDGSISFFANQDGVVASTAVTKNTAVSTPNVTVNTPLPVINAANASNYGNTPLISGTCTAGAGDVSVNIGSVPAGAAACSSGGTWQLGVDVNVSGLPDGFVVITATQGAGSGSGTATKDTVAPSVVITSAPPIIPANAASYVFSGSCSDSGTAVNTTVSDGNPAHTVSVAATCISNQWSVTRNMTAFNDGNITFTASQTDAAGNTTTPPASRVALKDLTPPIVTVAQPAQINENNQGNFSVTGACTIGDSSVSITIGGMAQTGVCEGPKALGDPGVWTVTGINARGLPAGPVQVTATQSDAAGNVGNAQATTTKVSAAEVDTTPPIVTVTAPLIGADNEGSYQPSGTCEAGSSNVTVIIGAGLPGAASTTAICNSNSTWTAPPTNVRGLPQGPVIVTATQSDSSGNVGAGQAQTSKTTQAGGNGDPGENLYPMLPVPVGGAWAGLLLLATGLGFLRRRQRRN
ncbi:beta strand repeat-containing protein [Ottowia thiooxydans]